MSAVDQATESARLLALLSKYLAIKPQPERNKSGDDDDDENEWDEEARIIECDSPSSVDVSRTLNRLKTFLHDDSLPEDYVTLLQSLPRGLLDAQDRSRNWVWSADEVLKYYASEEEDAVKKVVEEEINLWLKHNYKYELLHGFKCGGGIAARIHVYYGKVGIKKDWYTSPANNGHGDDKEGISGSEVPRWKLMVYYTGDEFTIYHSMIELLEVMLGWAEKQAQEQAESDVQWLSSL